MSNIKRFYEAAIADLAKRTGYSEAFLSGIWDEMCAEGNADFRYFEEVTFEHDW